MVLVDSSAWIEALRRKGSIEVKYAIDGLLDEYEAQTCSAIRLEVLGGAKKTERRKLNQYFSIIPHFELKEKHWNDAIALAWTIRDKALTIPWMDVLIAQIAIEQNIRLYTIDKHFTKISTFTKLRLYTPAYGGRFERDSKTE